VGIINKPVVQEKPTGGLIPVLGRRRLKAASELGMASVESRIVPAPMPQQDGFLMAFWDNIHRLSESACVAVIVKRLLELFSREFVAREFLPVLGVPPRGPRLEHLEALGGLEETILQALSLGHIHEKTALMLSELQPQERMALFAFSEELGLNANKKAEIVERLIDLSVFHARPVLEFIQTEEAQAVLADRDISVPERASRFRDFLRSCKFPELANKEAEFRKWRETLPRSDRLSVRPSPSFETEQCIIEIRADSRNRAAELINTIKDKL
jgi:ParB-like chromosome segregation protein Spo0J